MSLEDIIEALVGIAGQKKDIMVGAAQESSLWLARELIFIKRLIEYKPTNGHFPKKCEHLTKGLALSASSSDCSPVREPLDTACVPVPNTTFLERVRKR